MNYVEWLRVKRCIKWTAMVLGVILILLGIGRLAAMRWTTDAFVHIEELRSDKGSVVTNSVLADGTKKTVIDNAEQKMRVTILDRGYDGEHIEILHRGKSGDAKPDIVFIGSIEMKDLPQNGGQLEVIDTNSATFFGDYAIIAAIIAVIVATVLGAPFAREADGHFEIAATKPISREAFALQIMAADALGIVASFVIGVAFGFIAHAIFQAPRVAFSPADGIAIAIGILGPLAWYALLAAATASVKRGYGIILGFSWPIALLVVGFSFIPQKNAFAAFVHQVFTYLSYIDPIRYFTIEMSSDTGQVVLGSHAALQPTVLAILAVVYSALAVIQWRRVEA